MAMKCMLPARSGMKTLYLSMQSGRKFKIYIAKQKRSRQEERTVTLPLLNPHLLVGHMPQLKEHPTLKYDRRQIKRLMTLLMSICVLLNLFIELTVKVTGSSEKNYTPNSSPA